MEQTKRTPGLSASYLKIVAMVLMCVDHLALLTLSSLAGIWLAGGLPGEEVWMAAYFAMRGAGRLAFPLFAFFIAEGFRHTRSAGRYAARLAVFALLAEVPFDLAIAGRPFAPEGQNVLFTLLLGLLAAAAATFVLQEFVWTIEVEGNDRLPAGQIVQALEELGIAPGTWGPSIDSPETRNWMLLRMPELAWLAVNRSGGRVQVLVTERQQPPDTRAPYAVANVVAARDGVLTEVSVTEGMRLCAVGDTVRQGQLLVSGYEDYGLFIRPVCASAEIYARTWHTGTVVTPAERLEKRYTGREWKQVTLIVGKKRIKLWGNSSISQQDCDKMIVEKAVRTSGYAYPLRLETAILREYVLEPVPAPQVQTEKLLQEAWRRAVQVQMLAGRIDATQESLLMQGGLCILQAQSDCTELISRTLPLEAAD